MLTPYTAGTILDVTATASEETTPDTNDGIAILHTRTVDALRGFAKMVEKAEPEFRPVAQQFHDLHARHAEALAKILAAAGREVDANGSFMGAINETVIGLRAFLDEIDEDVMNSVRSGEDNILKAFDGALEVGLPPEQEMAIIAMREELAALLSATRHLD